jgi:hypothetical protein
VNVPRDRDLEHLLDEDGGEIGRLYRRLPRMEPPRRLDRSILGEAARAVHGRTPRGPRWIVGLGSAAGLVLAAGIAWHVGREGPLSGPHEAPGSARQVVPVEPISGQSRSRREHRAEAEPAPAPAAPAPAAAPPAQPPPAPLRKTAKQKAAPVRTPAAKPALLPAEPARAAPPAAISADQASATQEGAAASDAASADTGDRMGGAARTNAAAVPSASIELRRDMQLAPEDWLGHVRELLREGRRQQAIESLALFRRMHPQHPLPRDLQALDR